MSSANKQVELRICQNLSDIEESAWDALRPDDNPFHSWAFLEGLERAGCAVPDRGWHPCHLTCWQGERLIGAAPAYLKGDGMGDFSRDWGMADLVQRLGARFYPKLVVTVPFSPVTGYRFLVAEDEDRPMMTRALLALALEFTRQNDFASVHVLYCHPEERDAIEGAGLAIRTLTQYHWQNNEYQVFDDWLAALRSKKRTQIRRERRELDRQDLDLVTLRGDDLAADPTRWAEVAYGLYETTTQKYMWGGTYLTRLFFDLLFERLGNQIDLVLARPGGDGPPVAGAINLASSSHLYGRYWGCHEEHRFLHFNVCIYHGVEQCIERGLSTFEGGAGGEHKLARGFRPALVYSGHSFMDGNTNDILRQALASDEARRRQAVAAWGL